MISLIENISQLSQEKISFISLAAATHEMRGVATKIEEYIRGFCTLTFEDFNIQEISYYIADSIKEYREASFDDDFSYRIRSDLSKIFSNLTKRDISYV